MEQTQLIGPNIFQKKIKVRKEQNNRNQRYLPDGFVYIDQIDPNIISNLRYLSQDNFVGQKFTGYYVNRAILTCQAANALKKANEQFSQNGYQIVIYDAYRPQKAVNRLIEWSQNQSQISQKYKYYPNIQKNILYDQGYLAKRSGHTRGSTIDMTLINIGNKIKPIQQKRRKLANGQQIIFLDDNTQDFGTSFDFMHHASHPSNFLIPQQYINKRKWFIQIMQKHGFKVLDTQWFHFTLINEPFKDQYFDFDVK